MRQEPDTKPDPSEVFMFVVVHVVPAWLHRGVCLQGSHLMGFVEVSGSYQNGKGSYTEIDHISCFCVFS